MFLPLQSFAADEAVAPIIPTSVQQEIAQASPTSPSTAIDAGVEIDVKPATEVKLEPRPNPDKPAAPPIPMVLPSKAPVNDSAVIVAQASQPNTRPLDLESSVSVPLQEIVPDGGNNPRDLGVPDSSLGVLAPVIPPLPTTKPLHLLGSDVLPGTAARLAWAPKDSIAGLSAPTPVLVVHGKDPGPVVCLTAAVHGDELNGIEIVRQVMYDLDPQNLRGTVIGVPIVNLQGFRHASRYMLDRRDLNRYFPGRAKGSSAARIAHSFFTQVISHCGVLVDLHTGSFRRTNLPQLRADLQRPEVADLTKKMGAIVVLQGVGAKSSLRRAAVEAGIPAVTIEAGEPLHVGSEAVRQGVMSIESLLHNLDMVTKGGFWASETKPVFYRSRWVRASNGGILKSAVRLGDRVKKGQLLGVVTDPITNDARKIKAPQDAQVIGMALNQIMLPGFAAYHLGFQASVEEAAQLDAGPDEGSGDETAPPEMDSETTDDEVYDEQS